MSSIKPHDMDTEKDDTAVPYFSNTSKTYVYPSGIEFECNILTLNKIKKERSFKGFPINEDEED
jgi:hypothetical protein